MNRPHSHSRLPIADHQIGVHMVAEHGAEPAAMWRSLLDTVQIEHNNAHRSDTVDVLDIVGGDPSVTDQGAEASEGGGS